MGFALLALACGQLGSLLLVRSIVCSGRMLSVCDYVSLGSDLSVRSVARIGGSLCFGQASMFSTLSVRGLLTLGPFLFVLGVVTMDSPPPVLDPVQPNPTLPLHGCA